jgi:hypothetical protein
MFSQLVQLIEKVDDADAEPVKNVDKSEHADEEIEASAIVVVTDERTLSLPSHTSCITLKHNDTDAEQRHVGGLISSPTTKKDSDLLSETIALVTEAPGRSNQTFNESIPAPSGALVARCASAEAVLLSERVETKHLRAEIAELQASVELLRSMLSRAHRLEFVGGESAEATAHNELHYEIRSALQNSDFTDNSVRVLERTVSIHADTIQALQAANITLKGDLLEEEEAHKRDVERLESELAGATASSEGMKRVSLDYDRKCEEVRRLCAKVHAMQAALMAVQHQAASEKEQVAILNQLLLARDREIASFSVERAAVKDLERTKIYQAMNNKWWGPSVQRAASALDLSTMHLARFLRQNAALRLCVAIYAVLLHLYVFHVVSSVVHLMPHVGHDVHDHISNHLSK